MLHYNNLVECEAVIDFLDTFSSESTQRTYKSNLSRYFKWLKINPNEYVKSKRDFGKDIIEFEKFNNKNGLAPLTKKQLLVSLKKFLEHHDIEIKNKVWKNINNRRKGRKPITIDKIPNNSGLKRILQHADVRGRAIVLLLSSSGMRVGELVEITWECIDFDKRKIDIPTDISKNGVYRYTFFTPETKDALIEWKRSSPDYSKRAKARTEKCLKKVKHSDNGKVFPYTTETVGNIWRRLLDKAGKEYTIKDSRTKRYVFHIHTLRKFFNSKLKISNVPTAIVEQLLGHEGYLNNSYDRFTEEQVKKFYDDNSKVLSVFSDLYKIDEYLEPKLKDQDIVISSLARENQRLNQSVLELEPLRNQILEMQKKVDVLMEAFKESDWYKKEKTPLTREIETPQGDIVRDKIYPAPGENISDEELLQYYTDDLQKEREIKRLGLKNWAIREREKCI